MTEWRQHAQLLLLYDDGGPRGPRTMTAGPENSFFSLLPCIVSSESIGGMGVLGREKGPLAPGLGVERSHEVPSIPRSRRNFARPISPGEDSGARASRERYFLGGRGAKRTGHIIKEMPCSRRRCILCLHWPSCALALVECVWLRRGGDALDAEEARECRHRSVLATNLASVTAWPTKLFETLFPRYDGAQKPLARREEF